MIYLVLFLLVELDDNITPKGEILLWILLED